MDRALITLLLLQARALLRRMLRGTRTVKGGVFVVLGMLVFGMWLGPQIFMAHRLPRTDPQAVRAVAPVAILVFCLFTVLTSGGERAIVFIPAEVDLLFAGPFTRRQILAYRLVKSSTGAAVSALIFSVVFLRHASSWLAAVLGIMLGLLFLQYLGMVVLLLAQSIGERAHTWGRRAIVVAVLAALAIPVVPALVRGLGGGSAQTPRVVELTRIMRASPVGRAVLLPVEPFGYVMTAPSLLKLAGWSLIAMAVNAVLVLVIFWLDADYLESAAARSQVVQDRIARARKFGLGASGFRKSVRFSPRMLPFWGGLGPVIWRQMTAAVRGSKGLIIILVIVAAVAGPAVYGARSANADAIIGTLFGALAWMTVVVAGMIKFDFRGDLDHMEVLKSLPLRGWALCAGQVAVPVLLLCGFHWLVLAAMFIARPDAAWMLGIAAGVSLPFNALIFLIENLAFLMYPVRAPQGAMDFQNFGRQTLFFLVKLLVLLIIAGAAALLGLAAWWAMHSWLAVGLAGFCTLAMAVAGLLPLLVRAYQRYDVSLDTPA